MKCLRLFFIGTLMVTTYISSSGQLHEGDTLVRQLKLSSSGNFLAGNVDRFFIQQRMEYSKHAGGWGLLTCAQYQYGTFFHNKSEDDLMVSNFLYYQPRHKTYGFGIAQFEKNHRRKFDQRFQFGSGIARNFIDTKKMLLKMSINPTFERTVYNGDRYTESEYDGQMTVDTWRLTGRIYGFRSFNNNKFKISYEFWWQQSVQIFKNYRNYTNISLEIPVSQQVSFRGEIRYTYERVGLIEVKPHDLFVMYGLSFQFNK